MSLTKRIVDLDFIIKEVAVIIEALPQPCKYAVIMTISPNQIVLAIAVDITDQYRARKTLRPAWVKLPWTGIRITLGSFVPTCTDYNIASPIVV